MDFPILSLLILIPLIGALITLMMGGTRQKMAKIVAGAFSAITLLLAILVVFSSNDFGALSESYTWQSVRRQHPRATFFLSSTWSDDSTHRESPFPSER